MNASNVPHDANEFDGKRILVTGGTKGIAEAIVNRMRRGGAIVLATARGIPKGGKLARIIQADVSTRAGADHIVKKTFDRLTRAILAQFVGLSWWNDIISDHGQACDLDGG